MEEGNCKHCGGPIAIRNPLGVCDHVYWPDNLTDEAKIANGYAQAQKRSGKNAASLPINKSR